MAALELYAEVGWSGFNFDAVARRANVGKAPLYLRWSSREDLLLDAFSAQTEAMLIRDTGDLRRDLIDYACLLVEEKARPQGWAFLRIHLEASVTPELHARFLRHVVDPHIAGATKLLSRAVARGDFPAGTSPSLLLDSIYGAIIIRMILIPAEQRARLVTDPRELAEPIVDLVLAGAYGLATHAPDRLSGSQSGRRRQG
jgi:AcrR family transcriptional regulator